MYTLLTQRAGKSFDRRFACLWGFVKRGDDRAAERVPSSIEEVDHGGGILEDVGPQLRRKGDCRSPPGHGSKRR